MKKLIATLLMLPIFAVAQQAPPPGIKAITVPFQIFCADSFEYVTKVLKADFGETIVAMGYLREGPEPKTIVWFSNKENTQTTIVITKKTKYDETACIVWSGRSSMAFSVNPNPVFPPEPVAKEGVEM